MSSAPSIGAQLALSAAVGFLLLFVGFRILYDSVIPEVFGLVVAGLALASARPRLWWISLVGMCAGIALSEIVFPATPSSEHVARYGPPGPHTIGGLFLIFAFPTVGILLGLGARRFARIAFG